MTTTQRRMAMIALLIANFIGGLDTTMLNTALPQIIRDLNGTNQLGLLTSILLFFVAITTVIWGKVGERMGNKKAFQLSAIIFLLASLLGGLSWNIWVMIVARALMGIGIGGMVSIPYIIYAQLFPDSKERAAALGWVTAFYSVASILGPIAGGLVVDLLGWSWVFYSLIPFGLLSVILLQIFYKEDKVESSDSRLDSLGISLLVLLAGGLLVWIENVNQLSLLGNGAALLAFLVLAILLWRVEKRVAEPILPPSLLANHPYLLKNLLMVLVYGFTIGYSVYAPMWAQVLMGTNATMAGATQILSSVAVILATRLASQLFNRFSFQQIVGMGYLSLLLSAFMLVLAPADTSYLYLAISGAFMGLGQGLVFPPAQVGFQDDVVASQLNIATTFSLLMRTLGQTFMASIYGLVYAQNLASSGNAYPGFHWIFIIAFVMIILGNLVNRLAWKKPATAQ